MYKYILFLPLLLIFLGAGCGTKSQIQAPEEGGQVTTVDGSVPQTGNVISGEELLPHEPVICTDFEYSGWSTCNEDGEQFRSITKMSPQGCSSGNPVQTQKCKYKPTYVGTGPEILARMINQIRTAPNQRIDSSYVSGENGELQQELSYQILDNSLVIRSTLVHRDTNVAEPTVDFIDSNLDGFVDYWAKEDRIPHAFDKKSQEYSQVQTIWTIYLANFANNILNK